MLGYAYQLGALPLSAEAIEKAIEMNGEAVAMNVAAFRYGRRAAVDPAAVEALVKPAPELANDSLKLSQSFAETVDRRVAFLTAYQSARYARRYRDWVEKVRAAEANKAPGQCALSEAVARYLFKLMAYKDEYEVARLYTDTSFVERVKIDLRRRQSALRIPSGAAAVGAARSRSPASRRRCRSGRGCSASCACWRNSSSCAARRSIRSAIAPSARTERRLIAEYEELLGEIVERSDAWTIIRVAVALASIPEKIRGFGPVKERHLAAAKAEEAALREQFGAGSTPFLKAAE